MNTSFVGTIERITYQNKDNGWTVLKVRPLRYQNADLVAVVTHQLQVIPGSTMEFFGEWVDHPSFGKQFKAEKTIEQKPADIHGLEKYLGSGMIKGVGPSTAKKIVRHFGLETLDIFEEDIKRLKEIKGITEKKLKTIQESWVAHREVKELMVFLQQYEISTLLAAKIFKFYGKKSVQVVKENPYKLARDIRGIGFFTADTLAQKLGLSIHSRERYKAALSHVLYGARDEGHCYLTLEQMIKETSTLLFAKNDSEFKGDVFDHVLSEMLDEKNVILKKHQLLNCYFSPILDKEEDKFAKKIIALTNVRQRIDIERVKNWLDKYMETHSQTLSVEQREAVEKMSELSFAILTGGPGCGKTTTLKVLVKLLQAMGKEILLAAPTGRAAQRMSEVIGLEAKTLHRLLQYDPNSGGFQHKEENPLSGHIFVIDETSMLDISLASSLLKAVPLGTQCFFIGDADQLPAVGPGLVLRDLIASKAVPVFHLTKVFRQSSESTIITVAHQINEGVTPDLPTPLQFPDLWTKKAQTLFLDVEELTQEETKLLWRLKTEANLLTSIEDGENLPLTREELLKERLQIPEKFKHLNINDILNSPNEIEEIKNMLKKVHPYSALQFGLSSRPLLVKIMKDSIPKYWGKDLEIQILSPMHRGSLGTAQLNLIMQEELNPKFTSKPELILGQKIWRLGDRVIQKRNNYDLDVFNGDIGHIIDIDREEKKLLIEYGKNKEVAYEEEDMQDLDLAYAISIHKSQGSEFDVVVIPIATQHFMLLNRNLIYTAVTRAKKLAIFVGSRKALNLAIKNLESDKRQTLLKERLQNS